jgi:hypothetical protein
MVTLRTLCLVCESTQDRRFTSLLLRAIASYAAHKSSPERRAPCGRGGEDDNQGATCEYIGGLNFISLGTEQRDWSGGGAGGGAVAGAVAGASCLCLCLCLSHHGAATLRYLCGAC